MSTTTGTTTKTYTITVDLSKLTIPLPFKDETPALYVARVAKYLRRFSGLTQKQVQQRSKGKYSQAYVSRLEAGKWQSIRKANAYIRSYGVQMSFDLSTLGEAEGL